MQAEAFDYLRAERSRLLVEFYALLSECGEIRHADQETREMYLAKLRNHRLIVANHRLAWRWMTSGVTDVRR